MRDHPPPEFYSHSENRQNKWNLLREHLEEVAARAREFAESFGAGEQAYIAGLLHDLGKYGDLFQKRLKGEGKGLDHWSVGAGYCWKLFGDAGLLPALAIQGHHVGLQHLDANEMRKLRPDRITAPGSIERKLTSANPADLMRRFHEDGLSLPESITITGNLRSGPAAVMLEARMLFSTLVDADFLATERHFDCEKADLRGTPELNSQLAGEALDRYLLKLHQEKRGVESVASMRMDLLTACRKAAALPIGTFTLTAPTGSGKTLSMLAFALGHAKVHNLRRIVVVLPYLSIIEQTANEFRKALEELGSERLVLEHHSLTVTPAEEMNEDAVRTQAILAENWDAPIVVTTSVQCLESLFANKSAPCRKLHRLANSVILFDEVQTLPLGVIIPTLASLSFLAQRYGSTVVFATATQPAFTRLDGAAQKFSSTGWSPREIVPASLNLFGRTRRVKIEWPSREERLRWDDLVEKLRSIPRALCVVNLRRHSKTLFQAMMLARDEVFHLSTDMCPAHRRTVLNRVREQLNQGMPCFLVATQCVEAGVDIDFPFVFRAMGPLDSIAQAAGRCNRNGRLELGQVRVFRPAEGGYPQGAYRQAAEVTESLLEEFGPDGLSIDDPEVFERYFNRLYVTAGVATWNQELGTAISLRKFPETREHYRIIEQNQINVLVAYDRQKYEELALAARDNGLNREWIRRARPFTVNRFRPRHGDALLDHIEPVRLRDRSRTPSSDWFIHLQPGHYDAHTGLRIPTELEFLSIS